MTSSEPCVGYRFGSFLLDVEQGMLLTADGKEIPLRPKSFALLRLLVENAGRLLSKEQIMESLWPSIFVTENNVTQCVHDIRGALGAEAHQTLRTRPRRGYFFAANVIEVPWDPMSAYRGHARSRAGLQPV
jgi:DNA-binding winged helix-turn-helix (wHTH) protein